VYYVDEMILDDYKKVKLAYCSQGSVALLTSPPSSADMHSEK
jgi:hypothetical protein